MRSVLSVDVANGKSVVLLITEHGEVLIEPYEVKHCLNEFNQLKEKIISLNLKDLTIFMESQNNKRYLPHELKTRIHEVEIYRNGNSIDYV